MNDRIRMMRVPRPDRARGEGKKKERESAIGANGREGDGRLDNEANSGARGVPSPSTLELNLGGEEATGGNRLAGSSRDRTQTRARICSPSPRVRSPTFYRSILFTSGTCPGHPGVLLMQD